MKNQKGFAGWAVLGIVAVLAVVGIANYITYRNSGVRMENDIKARWENNENILGQYSLKVKEAVGVTKLMATDLKEVMRGALEGRYGEDGSQAVFQFIKEAYPGQVDPVLYRQVQQIVVAGRTEFQNNQTALVDAKRVYQNQLDYFWSGLWLGFAGYPKIDLSKYKIITSEHAQESFKTGVDKGVL
jgi:hypothetical protein